MPQFYLDPDATADGRLDAVVNLLAEMNFLTLTPVLRHVIASCEARAGATTVLVTVLGIRHRLNGEEPITITGTGEYDGEWTVSLADDGPPLAANEFLINGPFTAPASGGAWGFA